jgi:hypothetical protein
MLRAILGCSQFTSLGIRNDGWHNGAIRTFVSLRKFLSFRKSSVPHHAPGTMWNSTYAVLQKTLLLFRTWYAHHIFQCFDCSFSRKSGGLILETRHTSALVTLLWRPKRDITFINPAQKHFYLLRIFLENFMWWRSYISALQVFQAEAADQKTNTLYYP